MNIQNSYSRGIKEKGPLNTVAHNASFDGTGTPDDPLRPRYKNYVALLEQTGTSTPTVKILENTLGNIVWNYESDGFYTGTLEGAFKEDRTWCNLQTGLRNANLVDAVGFTRTNSEDVVQITIFNDGSDVNLETEGSFQVSIEIRVYDSILN